MRIFLCHPVFFLLFENPVGSPVVPQWPYSNRMQMHRGMGARNSDPTGGQHASASVSGGLSRCTARTRSRYVCMCLRFADGLPVWRVMNIPLGHIRRLDRGLHHASRPRAPVKFSSCSRIWVCMSDVVAIAAAPAAAAVRETNPTTGRPGPSSRMCVCVCGRCAICGPGNAAPLGF